MSEVVDFAHVPERQHAIDERLCNWGYWAKVRPHGWSTAPMFRLFRTKRQYEVELHVPRHVDTLDALKVERAVSTLPAKNRDALRWCYVFPGNPWWMAKRLGTNEAGLHELVSTGRTMLTNVLGKLPISDAAKQV